MFSWYLVIGIILYTIAGLGMMKVVNNYLNELAMKVARYDKRYVERLFYHIPVTRGSVNEFIVDVIFITLWPVICIVMIMKAEGEYDTIMRRNAFRNVP